MKKQQTESNKEAGIVSFCITETNEKYLNAITKYLQRTEYILKPDETVNIDGVINDALECAFLSKIKNLTKKHGLSNEKDFVYMINTCKDGKEVCSFIQEAEANEMKRDYDKILSQIPVPDTQKDLPI